MPIETDRLTLRPFAAGDVERIYALVYSDRELRDAWLGYRGDLAPILKEEYVTQGAGRDQQA